MSSISVNTITDASGGSTTSINGFTPSVSNMAGRNRIINGDMRIDQRNAGAAVAVTGSANAYNIDRWEHFKQSTNGAFTVQRSTLAPVGFTNSLSISVTSAFASSESGSAVNSLVQFIEGYNVADLKWGTADAKPITVSFWVRSSVTGNYTFTVGNVNYDRQYATTYSINSANTWEKKSITILGDTTGTWNNDNTVGIRIWFDLGTGTGYPSSPADSWTTSQVFHLSGTVQLMATNGATFYITGVQLEEGSVATPFCPAGGGSYGAELALCQRYYWNIGPTLESFQGFVAVGSTGGDVYVRYPVPMRSAPAITYTSLSDYFVFIWNSSIGKTLTGITLLYANTIKGVLGINWSGASGTAGTGLSLDIKNTEVLQFSSEL